MMMRGFENKEVGKKRKEKKIKSEKMFKRDENKRIMEKMIHFK